MTTYRSRPMRPDGKPVVMPYKRIGDHVNAENPYRTISDGARAIERRAPSSNPTAIETLTVTAPRRVSPPPPQIKPAGRFPLVGHPGLAESLIPVWGSGREAIANFQEGHPVEGVVNTVLALSDLAPFGFAAKDLAKMGYRFGKSNTWKAVRRRLGANGFAETNQPVHHVYIPNSSKAPDFIKHSPLNLKALPSHEVHGRVHGRWKDLPQYDSITKWHVETPRWSKAAQADLAGHASVEWYKDRP